MASIYQQEKNYENAFILYIKFTTLFVEKILSHPEYKTVDAITKRANSDKVKEVFPVAEKLKAKILERYEQEYKIHLEAKKQQEKIKEAEEAQRIAAMAAAAAAAATQVNGGIQINSVAINGGWIMKKMVYFDL